MQLEEPSQAPAPVQVQVQELGQGPNLWLQAVGEQRRLRARLQGRQNSVTTCWHCRLECCQGAEVAAELCCGREIGICQVKRVYGHHAWHQPCSLTRPCMRGTFR